MWLLWTSVLFWAQESSPIRGAVTDPQGAVARTNGRGEYGVPSLPAALYRFDPTQFRDAVKGLAREVLTAEATGDTLRARALLDSMAVLRPEVEESLRKLETIPVDIEVTFPV